jgi:curved DNA-binding protein CbpA
VLTRCPYEILEVVKDATPDQVKSAYRKKSKLCHSDVNDTDDSKMQELNEARLSRSSSTVSTETH